MDMERVQFEIISEKSGDVVAYVAGNATRRYVRGIASDLDDAVYVVEVFSDGTRTMVQP